MTSKQRVNGLSTDPASELQTLRKRLAEADAVLDAIRTGGIDALFVAGDRGGQVLELQGAEHDYRLLVEEMGEGAMTVTANGHLYFANRRLAAILGVPRDALTGSTLAEHIAPADRQAYQDWLQTGSPRPQRRMELDLLSAGGAKVPCHLSFTELPPAQKHGAFSVIVTDLSAHKSAEEAVRQSEHRLKTIVENLPIGVWFLDQQGQITYGNPTAAQIWGGKDFSRYSDRTGGSTGGSTGGDTGRNTGGSTGCGIAGSEPTLRELAVAPQQQAAVRAIRHGEMILNEELDILSLDGSRKTILSSAVPIHDREGEIVGAVVLNQDITDRKAAEEQIEQLAFFDALTQLPNRRLLIDRLGQVLAAIRRSAQHGAILFIDLDHFKDLNDSLGHDVGDQLLIQVAKRLSTCVRSRDTVARLGGDEFVVVLDGLSPEANRAAGQARSIAAKVQRTLAQPYELGTYIHHSTPSIGAALIDATEASVDELLKRADLAMYQAKEAGRNTLRFFDPEMQTAFDLRTRMEAQLREGLRAGQFVLHYQPQVDDAGQMIGAEALVRWAHPERGLLSPATFIHLAEESGLILQLGEWVLQAACAQLAAWSQHGSCDERTLAINISARQFREPHFVGMVRTALNRYGIRPHRLKLELTESLLLEDVEDTIHKMAALRELGLRFALDDFGTGYSSLSYLKRLPLDELKIDRSFVDEVTTDANDAAIVRAVLALAPQLGLPVIAEGVETDAQRRFLISNGCHGFQGYLFGRPGPADALNGDALNEHA
ncbi:EAL and GGDEF domain-containing protein [Halochromatium glycolicum]|uniref:cyclic-guanylate-specific phosphodiesterase n=1 Tax=Halochromatium glycolicum TaxID=85075 RepID=A0AAJ0U341_9GAMM|nr:EAL domain-containing protein [Halochromatium glycolicum]MBK1704203.1 hypothetical protein [Halochromatium glycolicum]